MSKQTTLPTIAAMSLSISLVAAPLGAVLAEEAAPAQAPAMPMMQGGTSGTMPGQPAGMGMRMTPEMMQQRRAMMMQKQEMQQHMAKMEGYLANIEALLRELVELNKAKN